MTEGFCQLFLACADRAEAEKIASALLKEHLVACAKFVPIDSMYWWQGKIESGSEVLLVMESRQDLFDQVEAAVAGLHSYDTFVLTAVPLDRVSKNAAAWLDKELPARDNKG